MAKNGNKNMKKKLIIALIIIFSVLLVLYIIVAIIPLFQKEEIYDDNVIADFDFYPADYSEDIYTDETYMDMIEHGILQYDTGAGFKSTVFPEDFENSNEPYSVVAKMLYSIIEGDHEEYNSYFSDKYFEKKSPKEKFTPQKIYNATLRLFKTERLSEESFNYIEYTFELKYYIYKNNGTFRKDIGEGYRTQYLSVTNRTGKLLIDDIWYERVKTSP